MSVATLALGEKLVLELKLAESTNTLARWMAHYVAELMVRAKHAAPPECHEAQRLCARAILDLWAQARAFPRRKAAFESIDRVIEAIESLHPDSGPHYRNELWRTLHARATSGNSEVDELLAAALGIDGAARNLIYHVLAQAAQVAQRDSAEWLELAEHLDEEDPLTELRIRIVMAGQREAQREDHPMEQLEQRIAQLEYFESATQALKASLMESLAAAKSVSRTLVEEREEPND